MEYVTEAMLARIGVKSPPRTATEPIGQDSLRRFVQATMEENPVHFDPDAAARSRFGAVVAPPLYPVHAFRRAGGTPDPLDRVQEDRDCDGSNSGSNPLPPLGVTLVRRLNGGSEVEFFRLAEIGEIITETSAYYAIEEKQTSSGGTIVLETIETEYTNRQGEPLIRVRKTSVIR